MSAIVTRGNAMDLHLPDETVDLIVTSPPYFGLRSYQDGGEHYAGQVGDEATPTEYLDALIACTAEWMRVLKPGGSIFVNLGDKYVADNRGSGGDKKRGEAKHAPRGALGFVGREMARQKSLMMLPQRYAIRCIDELGLILRAEIVWSKPNGLPESVTDRVRRSHEQVFHFVKQPRYYSAVDEVREAYQPSSIARAAYATIAGPEGGTNGKSNGTLRSAREPGTTNPLGKLPGSVWSIPTAPLRVPESLGIDHFAAYPPELVRRIVLGWSPREVCTACGEGRRPVIDSQRCVDGQPVQDLGARKVGGYQSEASGIGNWRYTTERALTGYACACPDTTSPATPGIVLDPFGGTGTSALVASAHGRVGISVDLSADYCRLAQWRTTDPGERARVLGVDKPPVQVDGQLGMFEGIGA